MKNKIIAIKKNKKLDFYLVSRKGKFYLFTQTYSRGVYNFFRVGRAEAEIKNFNKWEKNPRLDKTIEKLPAYMQYIMREVA